MQLHTHGAEGDQKRQNNQRVEYLIDLESKQMVQTEIAGRRFGCLTSGCANLNKHRLFGPLNRIYRLNEDKNNIFCSQKNHEKPVCDKNGLLFDLTEIVGKR